jgi:thiamine kinase-like enzyme
MIENSFNLGLSGCEVLLIGNNIVRKKSCCNDYNKRLLKQINKQKIFSNFILKNLYTPKIYKVKSFDNFYFDMEYIIGDNSFEYFSYSSFFDINFIIETLFEYIDFLINTSVQSKANNRVVNKIEKLISNGFTDETLIYILELVSKNVYFYPKSFCHGDLTFSNIIFHKNRLVFIDFLDSYLDSFLCDLAKLKQELYYKWYLKIYDVKDVRIHQIYSYIWNKIYDRYKFYLHSDIFFIIDYLNNFRIYPYLTNSKQKCILKNVLNNILENEKFNNSNVW